MSLIVYGETIQLVKSAQQEWDAACVLSLLSRFRQKHPCTRDADALRHALALLEDQTGEKKVFMLTDGYGVGGLVPFARQLKRAEESKIDVVGISVGLDESNVSQVFNKWCKAALPPAIPDALRDLYTDMGSADDGADQLKLDQWTLRAKAESLNTSDALDQAYRGFAEMQKALRKQRVASLERGNGLETIVVNLAFVVDMTGSMRQVLPMLIEQFKAMVDITSEHSIGKLIFNAQETQGIQISIHTALLGFRDIGEPEQFKEVLKGNRFFSDTVAENAEFINLIDGCAIQAKGGGDACEDVAAAFERAANWQWSGDAKFMILATDNPCHGADFHTYGNDPFKDSRYDASAHSRDAFKRGFTRCISEEIRVLHCTCDGQATSKMFAEMRNILRNVEASSGKPQTGGKRLENIVLSGSVTQATEKGVHIIFCLDESGSMRGAPWRELIGAFERFWRSRIEDQGPPEYVSVVQFSGTARTTHRLKPLHGPAPSLDYFSGGTQFVPPVQEASNLISQYGPAQGFTPVVILMSDGGSGDGPQAAKILEGLARTHQKRFTSYTVGFGSGADRTLQQMAFANGVQDRNNFRTASVGSLGNTFAQISQDIGESEASKLLVQEITDEIANRVQQKIRIEFL